MRKVAMWKSKLDSYYDNVTTENFKLDLEKSGFKIKGDSDSLSHLNEIHIAYAEVAVSLIDRNDESVFYSNEDLVESQPDKAIAIKI